MSTLYRPVLIESAEQAEALPIGTVAVGPNHYAATRIEYGLGWSVTGDASSDYHDHIIGWTALVPIEAEEETVDQSTFAFPDHHLTRLVTPWEEQS